MADALVFLPVFNQERELPSLLEDLVQVRIPGVEYLLVDNGSTDGSSKMICDSGLPYVRLDENRGVGSAYRIALAAAKNAGHTILSGLAANGKMLPEELPRLLDPIRTGIAHYVTGSRFLPGGEFPHLPIFRRAAIPSVSVVASLLSGKRLTDATNGFRAYRVDLLDAAHPRLEESWLDTYAFEYYVYAKALRTPGLRCLEVPATMRYPASGPYTKIRPGRDWLAMLRPWVTAQFDGIELWSSPTKD